jgi:hypothetical protein
MTKTKTCSAYEVTLATQRDKQNVILLGEFYAGSKTEAIRAARLSAERAGHTGGVGRYWFRASVIPSTSF